jgi:hypothetical protein
VGSWLVQIDEGLAAAEEDDEDCEPSDDENDDLGLSSTLGA